MLLKFVKKWVFSFGQGIADAEDRMVAAMFEGRKDESNKE